MAVKPDTLLIPNDWPMAEAVAADAGREAATLTLSIRGREYDVRRLGADSRAWLDAFELRKLPLAADERLDVVYHVSQTVEGWIACDCPDAEFRQRRCKHIAALVDTRLLNEKAARPAPARDCRSAGQFASEYPQEYRETEWTFNP